MPQETPKLPFSPDELRSALEKKKIEHPKEAKPEVHRDISHEIDQFESALLDVHDQVDDKRAPIEIPKEFVQSTTQPKNDGFFSEFEQFALHEDLEAEGLLDKDILHRMKEFHKHRREGKEYYVYSKEAKSAVQRKLEELKVLEQEWFHTRQQIDELEHGMVDIEREIESRTEEVKTLLQQAKSKSQLEQEVEPGNEFKLGDGRKLSSLLDLKIALRTMPPNIFHHHITVSRNDFADWVAGALGNEKVASELRSIRDKHQLDMFLSKLAG